MITPRLESGENVFETLREKFNALAEAVDQLGKLESASPLLDVIDTGAGKLIRWNGVDYPVEEITLRTVVKADKAMQARADEGCEVVVVSATFEPIVLRAMESHPFTHQISTRMKVAEDGTYTREVDGRCIEGDEKIVALKHWCDGRFGEGNWEIAYAYGDHHSDEPLLAAAKHPFAVTPNTGMEKIAKSRNWPILDWTIEVPKK